MGMKSACPFVLLIICQVIPYMGMKFATEISNIQRVGVIPYMGMKLPHITRF